MFEVTLHDPQNERDWYDPVTREKTQYSTLEVDAEDADKAKEFALAQNPGLEVTDVKELQ
jgi:hypothetical protein